MTDSNVSNSDHPFSVLTPEHVIHAVEALGHWSDGRVFALNSYENRVYQVGIEDAEPIIAKFYRPERWSQEQIQEEHDFCFELLEQELPVVCPVKNEQGHSLMNYDGLLMATFARKGGREPAFDNLDNLHILAQNMGKMHCVSSVKDFKYRPSLTVTSFGYDSIETVCRTLLPADLRDAYVSICHELLKIIDGVFKEYADIKMIRCHGDCHIGNILWRDDSPHFVDFDDARMAPAIQDLWMLLSGDRNQQLLQLDEIIDGYEMFMPFDLAELNLIEPLRTLRMMHHSAWLAKRWNDPAFPMSFPWFNTPRYWGEHILELKEQLSILQLPPLQLSTMS